jgi:hypothetical protein
MHSTTTERTMDTRTEWEQITAGVDTIQGRGMVIEYSEEYMSAVFVRTQVIYSTSGASRERVWDVVDYAQNENGRLVGTYYTVKQARMIAF